MAFTLWSQDIFTRGELSPFMYSRATVTEYGNGLKTAENVLTYPTGAAGKRFGTFFNTLLANILSPTQFLLESFQYANECPYQLVFTNTNIAIFLEGVLQANVTTTLSGEDVYSADSTVISTALGPAFRIAGNFVDAATGNFKPPFDLTRKGDTAQNVNAFTTNTFTAASPIFQVGVIYPIRFTVTGGTIMQTSPQIVTGKTYFVYAISTTVGVLFSTSLDAIHFLINPADFTNAYTIISLGTGTTAAAVQNTWTFQNTTFKNVPVYDFNGPITSYDAKTFTPTATSGNAVTININSPYTPLNNSYIGGAFIGGGGTSRITAVASTSSFTVAVQTPFASTAGILGSLAFLAEPAWSAARGYPSVCSSYQNRALFANTQSLPNGFWGSVINDYTDFDDINTDDDNAISWYPTSDNMNFIRFIVPYRSVTVHTNTGIYSSPLSDVAAITPNNFTLQLQDSTPADVLQPRSIDNQVFVISGNDVHQMVWDGINNAYTSDVVSIMNEQTIRNPQDEVAVIDTRRAGSRFVFIINENGTMATFQTLLSQNVAGFTIQKMHQSYGNASFLQAASTPDGRCWFVVQREIAVALPGVSITGFSPYVPGDTPVNSTLTAVATNFSTTTPTAVTFTTTGTLPASVPAITTTNYFWVIGVDADTFEVYLNQDDAINNENAIKFTSAGLSSKVVSWPLSTIYTLEELTEEVFLDCAIQYNGSAVSTVTTGNLFNAMDVKMVGDGFGFESAGEDNLSNQVNFIAHGSAVDVSTAYIGFPIPTVIEPMPLTISSGPTAKMTTLTRPKSIEWVRFMFNNTIGGEVNGIPISLDAFDMANIGEPPVPASGVFEIPVFSSWDDFENPSYTITHDEPFDIQLLGVFYSVEI